MSDRTHSYPYHTEYLTFTRTQVQGRKTDIVFVRKRDWTQLGQIKWFGRWRQFCFFPEPETTFNRKCLSEIDVEIEALMAERRGTSTGSS